MFVMVVMPTDGPVYMVDIVFFGDFFCFSHSFGMPILASRLLGASLAYSGYRAPQYQRGSRHALSRMRVMI